jgi:predicted Zn finger-like uncharacterized protein
MIITCEKCATRFRLDESLLKTDGSKVRCSLCKHIFTAFPPLPDAGPDLETQSDSAQDIPFETPEDIPPGAGAVPPESVTWQPESDDTTDDFEPDSLDFDETDFEETDFEEDLQQEADIEISFEDEDSGLDLETGLSFDAEQEKQIDFDSDDPDLEAIDPDDLRMAVDPDEPDLLSGLEMDLGSDVLDEEMSAGISELTDDSDAAQKTLLEKEPLHEKTEAADTPSEFDLTFDLDEENDPAFDEQALEKDAPDIQESDMTDGREAAIVSESRLDPDGSGPDEPDPDEPDEDEPGKDDLELDEPDDLDDLDDLDGFDDDDFDETSLEDNDPDTSDTRKPSSDVPPARRPARASLIQPMDMEGDETQAADASSKKQRALGTPVLILLLIFLLAAGGYVTATLLGYKIPYLPEIKIPFLQQHLSQQSPESLPALDPVPDQKSVTGRFITNDTSGELFIITGNIENPAQIPYRHIQVKGTLFQKEKTAAMTQIAYCGNIVPENALKTGNIDDIMAQLRIPGGAADINAKVMPGHTVPFMLVFSDLPQNLENFTVEVAGFEKTTP